MKGARELVFVDDARVFGGGQRNVLRLARFVEESLSERSARVICPVGSELARRCRAAGILVTDAWFPGFGLLAPLQILRAVGRLRRLLHRLPPEAIVVGMSLRTQVYLHAAALGSRARIVHFLPEQDSARRAIAKLLLRRYGSVVVVGDAAAQRYEEVLKGVRVHAVNNFLLPEEFAAATRDAKPAVDGPPTVGVLTRLVRGKGVVEVVDELAAAPDAWSRLLVAGARQDEAYASEVEARIAERRLVDRVRLLGEVEDLGKFFGEVDVLVVPSVGNEGQPTAILDALAHGRPAIVRAPIWSPAFEGLPVLAYRDAGELECLLDARGWTAVASTELAERFSPLHVVDAIEAAAGVH